MSTVRAGIAGILAPADFPSVDHAHLARAARRDFIRLLLDPGSGDGIADRLTYSDTWSTTLHLGEMTDRTAHPITITTRQP
ncbi:hypothetical protein ACFRMQ_10185 [Kitasatospora sp. NPDC056783]|uniref:hypothetical protein n=1 Tax=Kitasatospora sp. NPDC056783 TaxID=3345943 RepID=UPI0036A5BA87